MTTTIELQDTEACVVFQSAGGFEVHIPPTAEDAEIAEDSPTHNAVMVAVLFGDNPASLRLREMVSTLMLDGASPPMTPEPTHQTRSCKVHAEQFWPDVKPWPEGVAEERGFRGRVSHLLAGHTIVGSQWIVKEEGYGTRVLYPPEFEDRYRPIPPPTAEEDTARHCWNCSHWGGSATITDATLHFGVCDIHGRTQVNGQCEDFKPRQAIDAARKGGEGT